MAGFSLIYLQSFIFSSMINDVMIKEMIILDMITNKMQFGEKHPHANAVAAICMAFKMDHVKNFQLGVMMWLTV